MDNPILTIIATDKEAAAEHTVDALLTAAGDPDPDTLLVAVKELACERPFNEVLTILAVALRDAVGGATALAAGVGLLRERLGLAPEIPESGDILA